MAYGSVLTDVVQSSTAGTPPQFNDGNSTQIGTLCRAWVNFNGTSGSIAIRASFNVSSITYTAAGKYTINFTNTLPDTNYGAVFGAQRANQASNTSGVVSETYTTAVRTTSALAITDGDSTNGFVDSAIISVAIFR